MRQVVYSVYVVFAGIACFYAFESYYKSFLTNWQHNKEDIANDDWLYLQCKNDTFILHVVEVRNRCRHVIHRKELGAFWYTLHEMNQDSMLRAAVLFAASLDIRYSIAALGLSLVSMYCWITVRRQKSRRVPYFGANAGPMWIECRT